VPGTVFIDGETLTLEQVSEVARRHALVEISDGAGKRVIAARQLVERLAAGDAPTYGVNTGFGTLSEVRIDKGDLKKLQRNLILSHSAGVGAPLSEHEARAMLLLRANALAKGYSGVRFETLSLLCEMLNRDVIPVIPERGSVGASGDLAPLAHLALALIGEGEVLRGGTRQPSGEALRQAGLQPVTLEAKEGLSLVNGTQAMGAVGVLALLDAEGLCELADVAGAMTVEGLLGSHKPFGPEMHRIRPHPGQSVVASHLRELLRDSEIVKSHENCGKVQDAYSLRCMPQIHGAAREGVAFTRGVLSREINSATDNPLVFVESGEVISGGNFHGQPVSQALDILAIAITQLAVGSERRVEQLVNPALSGLPPFLAKDSGLNSGFMIAQVTAAALVAESRILSHPACVDSIPSSAGREDHVSMGMGAALKARQVVSHVRTALAIELLVAAQALDLRRPLRPGRGVARAYEMIRRRVPHMDQDRVLARDIEAVMALAASGELLAATPP
jgi:histidine ammonia-lyase